VELLSKGRVLGVRAFQGGLEERARRGGKRRQGWKAEREKIWTWCTYAMGRSNSAWRMGGGVFNKKVALNEHIRAEEVLGVLRKS